MDEPEGMAMRIPFPRTTRTRLVGRLLCLPLLAMLVVLGGAEQARTAPAGQALEAPFGRWTTFANGDDVLSLAGDGDVLWSGTRAGGLVRWDLRDGSAVQFLRPQDPLGGNTIRDIEVGEDGRVWLATDGGLTVLADGESAARDDDLWHTWTFESTGGMLPSDDIRAVAISGDTVWVGTAQVQDPISGDFNGGGLARLDTRGTLDPSDDEWAPVQTFAGTYVESPTGDDKVGLVSDTIHDLALNEDGDLWIATGPHWIFETQSFGEVTEERWVRVHGGLSFVKTQGTFDPTDDVWTSNSCEDLQETVTCGVQAVAIDHLGFAWAAIGGRGVMWFSATDGRIIDERSRRFSRMGHPEISEPLTFVESITFGPAGDEALANTVWLGTRKSGLAVLDHGGVLRNTNDDVWHFGRETSFGTADGLARERVQAVVLSGGKAWAGTGPDNGNGGGISPVDLVDLTVGQPLTTDFAPPTNFVTDLAFGDPGSLWQDKVWVATGSRARQRFGAGATVLDTAGTPDTQDDSWQHYNTLGTDADGMLPWTGLSGDNVHAVTVRGNNVFLGSVESTWDSDDRRYSDGGLTVFDGTSWTARTMDGTGGREAGLRDGSVSSVAVDCDGDLWVGTGNPWDAQGAGVDVLRTGTSVHVLSQDTWTPHNYVDKSERDSLPSRNITALAADCDARTMWASAAHHVRLPVQGSPGGALIGGGTAAFDLDGGAWTRYDVRHGLSSYHSGDDLLGEALSVFAQDGEAWVGTYGTNETTTISLVRNKPYWPATLNHWDGSAWSSTVFESAGRLSGIARDQEQRLWVATSRGGLVRFSAEPENWRDDRGVGGLMVGDGTSWVTLTVRAGLPSEDISVVRSDPAGNIWIGTEGWGLARFEPNAGPPPTPTLTPRAASPTPTATQSGVEPTPTNIGGVTATPTPTPMGGTVVATATSGTPGRPTVTPGGPTLTPTPDGPIYLPWTRRRNWP
jgi:ligand-binding sensor domain-containing protein